MPAPDLADSSHGRRDPAGGGFLQPVVCAPTATTNRFPSHHIAGLFLKKSVHRAGDERSTGFGKSISKERLPNWQVTRGLLACAVRVCWPSTPRPRNSATPAVQRSRAPPNVQPPPITTSDNRDERARQTPSKLRALRLKRRARAWKDTEITKKSSSLTDQSVYGCGADEAKTPGPAASSHTRWQRVPGRQHLFLSSWGSMS